LALGFHFGTNVFVGGFASKSHRQIDHADGLPTVFYVAVVACMVVIKRFGLRRQCRLASAPGRFKEAMY
jgi:hypothetical protein